MSSNSSHSSARSSPSSGKFPSSQQQHSQQQYNPMNTSDQFVIPGQQPVRFPGHPHSGFSGHPSPNVQSSHVHNVSNVSNVHNPLYQQQNNFQKIVNAIPEQFQPLPAGFRRSSDAAADMSARPSSSAGADSNSPPIIPKSTRRFSLAQALSNNSNNSSSSSGSLFKSLSKAAKGGGSGSNVSRGSKDSLVSKERKDSTIGPLVTESNSFQSNPGPDSRPKSPEPRSSGGRKGSTTSIGSTANSKAISCSSNGAGKRRQSRISFFTHRLGSEAIPDMKSLSINPPSSSCGGKNQGHGFLPHLLHSHHENRKPSQIYRLVVLGGSKVGKTAIVQRFLYNTFPETHSATVEELHRADYEVKGLGIVGVEILDTSGSFPFPAMQRLAISSGHAFILVYSVDDKESFEEVARLRELVISVKSSSSSDPSQSSQGDSSKETSTNVSTKESSKVSKSRGSGSDLSDTNESNPNNVSNQVPLVVVANKSDLDESDRQVGTEMAECECIDWDVAFVESSALSGDNIMNIFHKLLLQAHLKGILKTSTAHDQSNESPTKLKVSKAPKVSNRRRSSLPVNDLFHSTARHLPLFGKGGSKGGGGGGEGATGNETTAGSSTSGSGQNPASSPTTSAGGGSSSGDHSSAGRSSCALS